MRVEADDKVLHRIIMRHLERKKETTLTMNNLTVSEPVGFRRGKTSRLMEKQAFPGNWDLV
jgi:hypothetical protein